MRVDDIDAWLVQETWLEDDDFDTDILKATICSGITHRLAPLDAIISSMALQ
jgi:hypothetical protein